MRSIALITALLPIANALQDTGGFNQPLVSSVDEWTKRVKEAAAEDRINNQPMLDAIEQVRLATDFDSQQAALLGLIDTMSTLLDDIPAGRLPEYVAPLPETSDLLNLMKRDVTAIIDRFEVANDVETRMRKTASQLHASVTSSVIEGKLPESAMLDVEIVADAVNYIGDDSFSTRNTKMINAEASLRRLAA